MHKNNSLMLKSQQKFRSEKHNIFTEKLHKTALSFNDSKGIKSIDSAETYTYGINYDDVTNENMNKHDLNWPQIPDHPCRILIIRDSRSRKTNGYLI